MFNLIRDPLLRFLKVPPSPEAPAGSPESTKVFNAGRNYYLWSVVGWAVVQCIITVAILALFVILPIAISRNPKIPNLVKFGFLTFASLAILIYTTQLFLTFFALRLGYEMRWYIVTDRSLRIRAGVWSVQELTMTFANIQQISVKQGPLQRLLGIADVEVTNAGGGSSHSAHGKSGSSGHTAYFHGVDNADQIRDLILDRVRHYKDSGLGDPDNPTHIPTATEAAQEVLNQTRQLKATLSSK